MIPSGVDTADAIVSLWEIEDPRQAGSDTALRLRLFRAGILMQKSFREQLWNLRLSPGEMDVLAALRRAGSPYELTPTSIATIVQVTSGGLTSRLNRLEAREWITRSQDSLDGRRTIVRLTEAGSEELDLALERLRELSSSHFVDLSEDEKGVVNDALRKILIRMGDAWQGF